MERTWAIQILMQEFDIETRRQKVRIFSWLDHVTELGL